MIVAKTFETYKTIPILTDPSMIDPTVPMIKISPEVDESVAHFVTSLSLIFPCKNKSVVIFEPIGYPEIMLMKNAWKQFAFKPKSFCMNFDEKLDSLSKLKFERILQRNMKGKSPGRTAVKKSFRPFVTLIAQSVASNKMHPMRRKIERVSIVS